MKLENLINYFRKGGSFERFCKDQSLNPKSEVIEIFMEKPFSIESSLSFFEIEKTEGKNELFLNNTKFYNLFDFFYFLDVINESKSNKNIYLKDIELANKLLSYAIQDA